MFQKFGGDPDWASATDTLSAEGSSFDKGLSCKSKLKVGRA
jgi:hypothetical protein